MTPTENKTYEKPRIRAIDTACGIIASSPNITGTINKCSWGDEESSPSTVKAIKLDESDE